MFRIKEIVLYHGTKVKKYCFTDNAYIYGNNSVGKTAFTRVIDFVLGSTEGLAHDGLDCIDEVGAYITNAKTELWIKRSIVGEFSYKRTENSEYSIVSLDTYKDTICNVINDHMDLKAIRVYKKIFEENPSFRSFTFMNFVDEIGQGDLGTIFTRGNDVKHIVRLRKIMDFFFNYENAEKIYEKSVLLDDLEKEYKKISDTLRLYEQSRNDIKKLFRELGLSFSGDMSEDYNLFKDYKESFTRNEFKSKSDLAYLLRASHSLSEEIKVYGYLKSQSETTSARKERTEKLLSLLKSIVAGNPVYVDEVATIDKMIKDVEKDKIILSLADYDGSIEKIYKEKEKIDGEIQKLKGQVSELDYEDTIKKMALVENHFLIINADFDLDKATFLQKQILDTKKEIKNLKNSYSKNNIDAFNNRLTEMYLNSKVRNVQYLNDDRNEEEFILKFDPFSQNLVAYHKDGEANVMYIPGSMARHNHLQLLVYLCMFEYLHKNFSDFIYLPILIMDSPDQPMEIESFEEIYPAIIGIANEIGIQTIFFSKTKLENVDDKDLIDISNGFNPFHQMKEDEVS